MATDWNTPALTDEYSDFRDILKEQLEGVGQKDFTADTNVPVGFIRLNSSTDKQERYTGSSWVPTARETEIDNHLNSTTIHGGIPIGSILPWLTGAAPTGFFILDGTAKSRTTYSELFALWGTSFGAGDGSTTFGIPDMRGRVLIGKTPSGTAGGALGDVFGAIDHLHTGPSHTHTVAGHTHDMGNHTHTGGAHTHTTPNHTHTVPAHYHNVGAAGADIAINSSGAHTHTYGAKEGGSDGSTANRAQGASASSGSNVTYTTGSTGSAHVHAHGDFTGRVGNVSAGVDGDASMTSGSANGGNTGSGGAVATGAPSTNTTSSTALTSDAGGTGNTGTANPPCMIVNWLVKAL